MEPELCAAMHHVIYDLDEDCFSETSLDFPDFLENEFQNRVLEEPVVGRDQGFDVDQGLHDEGSSPSLSMSAEATTAAEHTTSTPPEHAVLHHVSAVPRDGAVGVSYLLLDSGASVHLVSESMFSSGAAELVEDLGTGGVGCVTATGEDIQIRRKAKVRVRLALCASSSSSPASVPVTFEALVAPDVRFSLLSLGLLLKKGWSVSFGSEPRVFGPKVSRGRPKSGRFPELFLAGLQHRKHTSSDRCYARDQCATRIVLCLHPSSTSRWHPAPTPRKSGEHPTRRRTNRVSRRGQGRRQQGRK